MKNHSSISVLLTFLTVLCSYGQANSGDDKGFGLGGIHIEPHAGISAVHDNRVNFNESTSTAESDVYADVEAGLSLYNLPALFSLSADALFGHRYYDKNNDLNDDFYNLGASIRSEDGPWSFDLSSRLSKDLSYNTKYDPATGEQPASILTDQVNQRWVSSGGIAYDRQVSERTSIEPSYTLNHYYQDFDNGGTAEWQIHTLGLRIRHQYSEKIHFYTKAEYSLQTNEQEDGTVGRGLFGAEGRLTDKTAWLAEVGYAVADYEQSGTEQAWISKVQGSWQFTDKIETYVFGGNDFEPGYGGDSARRVYRAGYGVIWTANDRFDLQGSVLHDYQETVGDAATTDPTIGELRNFLELSAAYALANRWQVGLAFQYVNDEIPVDQRIIMASVVYAY